MFTVGAEGYCKNIIVWCTLLIVHNNISFCIGFGSICEPLVVGTKRCSELNYVAVTLTLFAVAHHKKFVMDLRFINKLICIIAEFKSTFYNCFKWSFFFTVNNNKLLETFFVAFRMFHCISKPSSI